MIYEVLFSFSLTLSLSLSLSFSFSLSLSSIPTITEEVARQVLHEDVCDHCCYGTGAAENLVITNIQSSSAFHVSISVTRDRY